MSVQTEFTFAASADALNCIQVRKGKDGAFVSIGSQMDWWTEVFPFAEWVEKECVLNKRYKPYNNCYRVQTKGKVKYYMVEMPKW